MRRDSSGTTRSARRRAAWLAVLAATLLACGRAFAQSAPPPADSLPAAAAAASKAAEKPPSPKGTGFSPYVTTAKSTGALAPEGCSSPNSTAASAACPSAPSSAGDPAAPIPAAAPDAGAPIAIVPVAGDAGQAPTVTGALEVTGDKAIIAAGGAVSSGSSTTDVTLPHRGILHVCASTTVKLAADTSVPAGETPGLLLALDHGAMEADLVTGPNSDVVLTPDFRILISGPGAANLKLRLGSKGDTCIDNGGVNAPYVLVTSLFGDGMYRVQAGQRVLFEHGSVHDVVDKEKEPCGCPPAVKPGSNEFPLAQSEGLVPLAKPAPAPPPSAEMHLPLVYNSAEHAPSPAPAAVSPAASAAPVLAASTGRKAKPKHGFFRSIGRFFRRVFGAD